jgi:hypothetical protein
MAIADIKKVQTMINVAADQMEIIRSAVDTVVAIRTAFQAHNPDVTGTPLEGKVATLNAALNDLQGEADEEIWTELIAARVPSHRGVALEG